MDIQNESIQTSIEDEKDMAIINIRGVLVDIMLEVAPDVYGTYVIMDHKGTKKLIFQFQNTIYGTMSESLIYYKKSSKSL